MRGLALTLSSPGHWLIWGRLPEAVATGEPQAVAALGDDLWGYYTGQPAEAADFAQAMAGVTSVMGGEAARLIDTTGVERAIDVGGGNGSLLHALMAVNPGLSGVVLDLPSQVEEARAQIGRLRLHGGSPRSRRAARYWSGPTATSRPAGTPRQRIPRN